MSLFTVLGEDPLADAVMTVPCNTPSTCEETDSLIYQRKNYRIDGNSRTLES